MAKIKVLHVLTVLNKGGLETMLMNYFRNINKDRFEFHFLVQRESGYYEREVIESGGYIHRVNQLSYSPLKMIKYLKQMNSFFKNNQFDVVHVHSDQFGYFPLKYAKKNGCDNLIIHCHSTNSEGSFLKKAIGIFLNKRLFSLTKNYFACSENAGKWMYGDKKFIVINNAIDIDDYYFKSEIRESYRKKIVEIQKINIVHIGRFNLPKNHLFLLDVFAEIIKKNDNYKLFLVGDGELRPQILSKIKELGLENKVQLLGIRNDIPELLQAMDIFLFPSLFEGLPVSLVEAQATGIKCVISDGVPEEAILIPENVEVISLKKSAKEWADKILQIQNFDRKDVSEMIKEKGYDIKENAKKLEEKYRELLTLSKL